MGLFWGALGFDMLFCSNWAGCFIGPCEICSININVNIMIVSNKTENSLINWLEDSPESLHSYDNERFGLFIRTAKQEGDLLSLYRLPLIHYVEKCHPRWCKKFKKEFVKEWMPRIIHAAEYEAFRG